MFRQLLLLALASMVFCQVDDLVVPGDELDEPMSTTPAPYVAKPIKKGAKGQKIKKPLVREPSVPSESSRPSPYDQLSVEELLARPLDTEALQQILVRAQPGKDYPVYSLDAIPETSFRCDNVHYPGYYADIETGCQVFHFCPPALEGLELVPQTFICPNLTIFNNRVLVCDWFFNVDCKAAESLFDLANSRLYQTALPLLDDVEEPSVNVAPQRKIKKNKVKSMQPVKPVQPVEDDLYSEEQ